MPITQERFASVIAAGLELALELELLQSNLTQAQQAEPTHQRLTELAISSIMSGRLLKAVALLRLEEAKVIAVWNKNKGKRDWQRRKRQSGPSARYNTESAGAEHVNGDDHITPFLPEPPEPNNDWD